MDRTPSHRIAVCVLGFHRSGTSMTTRMLNLLGVELGADLLPPDADNPRGFWEPRWMVRLNDEILDAVGASYMRPPRDDAPWGELESLRARAGALLDENLPAAPVCGFKDPRLCLTWPFWSDLVAERVDEIRYVICLRSPVETAASMVSRGRYPGVEHHEWGDLWLQYVSRSLTATRGAPRLLVFYDDLLRDGAAERRRLASQLGIEWPEDERALAIEESVDAGMRHHASSLLETVADERLPAAARTAFASLCAAADARRNGADGIADVLERSVEELGLGHRTTTAAFAAHRDAALDALGEVQRADVREDALSAQVVHLRDEALRLHAELADIRSAERLPRQLA